MAVEGNVGTLNTARGELYMWLIVIVNSPVSITEKDVYYADFEPVVVTTVQGCMNLIPYEYVVCRQETQRSRIVLLGVEVR